MKTGKVKVKKNSIIVQVTGKEKYSCADFVREDLEHLHNQVCTFEIDENNTSKVSSITVEGKVILPDKGIKQSKQQISERKAKQREVQEKRRLERKKSEQNSRGRQNDNTRTNDSYSLGHAQVPSDVKEILGHQDTRTANFYLKLFKFARFDNRDEKFKFFAGRKSGNFEIKSNNYGGIFEFGQITANQIVTAKKLYGEENQGFITKSFKPDWRFVVGLGTDSVYETGITLHHIYGFPYIPASAIKGIVRNYIINRDFDLTDKECEEINENKWSSEKEKKALRNSNFQKIFGDTSNKGKIIFLDAMPKTTPQLKTDIMNPHYPDWYGSGTPPTDTQSPRPIPFLTVEETEYQFILASKDRNKELLKIAMEWLENALKEKGIGAKTAVGYGYMTK